MKKILLILLLIIPTNIFALEKELSVKLVDYNYGTVNPYEETNICTSIYSLLDNNKNFIKEILFDDNCISNVTLEEGDYYLIQKSPGIGYMKEENLTEIRLDNDKTVIIKNNVIRVNVFFYKYSEIGKPIEGIEYKIYLNDKYIGKGTTNNEGLIRANLRYGTYHFIQMNSLNNEIKKDVTYKIDSYKEVIIKSIDYEKYKLNVQNKSDVDNTFLYQLKDDSNNILFDNINLSELNTKELLVGKYYIKQVSVNNDYILNKEEYEVELTSETKEKVIEIINKVKKQENEEEIKKEIELPKTTEENQLILLILSVLLLKEVIVNLCFQKYY